MSLSLDSYPLDQQVSAACGLKKSSPVGVLLLGFFISVTAWNKPAFVGASSELLSIASFLPSEIRCSVKNRF